MSIWQTKYCTKLTKTHMSQFWYLSSLPWQEGNNSMELLESMQKVALLLDTPKYRKIVAALLADVGWGDGELKKENRSFQSELVEAQRHWTFAHTYQGGLWDETSIHSPANEIGKKAYHDLQNLPVNKKKFADLRIKPLSTWDSKDIAFARRVMSAKGRIHFWVDFQELDYRKRSERFTSLLRQFDQTPWLVAESRTLSLHFEWVPTAISRVNPTESGEQIRQTVWMVRKLLWMFGLVKN